MKVLFYSPEFAGHHFAYLARMLPSFLELPLSVHIATTPEAMKTPEFAKTLAAFSDRVTFHPICTDRVPTPFATPFHRMRDLVTAIRTIKPDHVAVCYADGIWEIAVMKSILGQRVWPTNCPIEGWLYRGMFVQGDMRPKRSFIRRKLFSILLKRNLFTKLHLDHELLFEFANKQARKSTTEVVLTPNPVVVGPLISKCDARAKLKLAEAGRWISLSGMIMEFKGVPQLIEAFDQLRNESGFSDLRLLLAGPHNDAVRSMLRQPTNQKWVDEGAIVSIDRFLDEEEMYQVAAASDLVVAPYNHHGRSSIVLWAAAAGRPSLASESGCVGYVSKKHRLGGTCDVLDVNAIASAIKENLSTPWTQIDVERVRDYAEFHSVENYRQIASALVRSRLGGNAKLPDRKLEATNN